MADNSKADIFDGLNFVSRGGQKLAKALDYFKVTAKDKVCIDCGASTGGFTDCLLKGGAKYVYAVDVGYGQFAWPLRNDPRVKVMERTNIRYVTSDMLPVKPELAVIDVSFISLSIVLPVVHKLMTDHIAHSGKAGEDMSSGQTGSQEIIGAAESSFSCEAICLIKPQFEAGKGKVGKKGVVRDPKVHEEVLCSFMEYASGAGFTVNDITHSPIKGPKGNIEYLAYLSADFLSETMPIERNAIDIKNIVDKSHKELDT
ncbi:MAG: TlyA family RNA methyltransferase [Oscillospiraceae bacterium]|nr:TlyA family RNA methyltransferase [Oscillospiraceae bacterium]